MTNPPSPRRIAISWSTEARAQLRAIDRESAMQILHCIDLHSGGQRGDVKKLRPPLVGLRLRCGHYRVFFRVKDEQMQISTVRHRKEAYR
jgi:mRNA-degrading endonuclease RelE of RelBE toxin-antitoxin system